MQTNLRIAGLVVVSVAAFITGCATQSPTSQPAASAAPPAAQPAKAARTPQDIEIAELLDDPKKLAIFRKYAPDVADNPQIGQARGMSLAEVAGYASGILTPEVLASIAKDLSML